MEKYTSVQVGLKGFGKEEAQSKMFEECNTAIGQGGYKLPLIKIKCDRAKVVVNNK